MGHNAHLNIRQWLTRRLGFSVAMATNQTNDMGKIHMVVRRQLKSHFFTVFVKIFAVTQQLMAISMTMETP